ncbi:hypothetical protein [Pseudomonas chlororaphis]
MTVKQINLTTPFIGEGPKLFHVDLLAADWEGPTMWLVAANDLDAAFEFAMAEHSDYDRAAFDDGRDGYEIGEFSI